jgi:hypothetical protein
MRLRVACYAGYKGSQRPLRFGVDSHWYTVEEILDQWYSPGETYFKVRADDGNQYILRARAGEEGEEWTLESYSARGRL